MESSSGPAPHTPRRSRGLRVLRWVAAVLAVLLVLAGAIAWWASSDGSLDRALRAAAGMLPEGQSLEYRDARGSIMGGGRIAYLRWSSPGTVVTLEELRLRWSLGELFGRALHVRELSAERVHVRLTPQPERPEDEPFTMPQEVTLPVELSLPLRVRTLEVETGIEAASSTQRFNDLVANYSYDHARHSLALVSLRYAESSLRGSASLGARDLALVANFEATLQNLVPDSPLAMRMRIVADGSLSGGDAARVDLRLDADQQSPQASVQAQAAAAAQLQAQATLHPWRDQPLQSLLLEASGINARAFAGGAPVTAIGGSARVTPSGADAWDIHLDFTNQDPGPLDEQRLPLDRVEGEASITPAQWLLRSLQLRIGEGGMRAAGEFDPQTRQLQVRGDIDRLPLRRIHRQLASTNDDSLAGAVTLEGIPQRGLAFNVDVNGRPTAGAARARWEIRSVQARGRWSPQLLSVERVEVSALRARATGRDIQVGLPDLVPASGTINADAPGFTLAADVDEGRAARGSLSLKLTSAEEAVAWLRGLPVLGESIPALTADGSATVEGNWNGGWRQWLRALRDPASQSGLSADLDVASDALALVLPPAEPGREPMHVEVRNLNAGLAGNFSAAQLMIAGETRVDGSKVVLDTNLRMARAGAKVSAWNFTVTRFAVAARLPGQEQDWTLRIAEGLRIGLNLGNPLQVEASAGQATLAPPVVSNSDEALTLSWEPLRWQRSANGTLRVNSRGSLRGLRPGWIDELMAAAGDGPLESAGLYSTLVLDGEWDIQMSDELSVRARLKRESGDLWLGPPEITPRGSIPSGTQQNVADRVRREGVAAGVQALDVVVQSRGDDIAATFDWNTERAGVISGNLRTSLSRAGGGWRLPPDAPVAGSIEARIQELGIWGFLAPPGWRVQGELRADLTLDGTVQAPRAQGTLAGSGLNVRSVLDGVDLHDGMLRASVQGQRLLIEEFTIQGGTGSRAHVRGISGNRSSPSRDRGSMTVRGSIDWSGVDTPGVAGSGIDMDLRAELQRMQVLVRNDRQVTLSGDLSAGLAGGALQVRGDLKVDRAAIMLPESRAPTLGDDVVVHRNGEPFDPGRPARGDLQTAKPMDLEIRVDLGNDLALQGYGITTRLEGDVTVSSGNADNPFRVVGEVRTDEGRFRAWGQALNVETGSLLFNGPYDNPSLDMLAIRPEIEVRAGVRITGTAQAPRVTLYSEPELPEAEKLSWVLMGRASIGGGTAEGTSMQEAALGLLAGGVGGGLADDLGLDELGLSDSSVSIGKRISRELYMTYEAGLGGATSTLYLFYDITRRLTARGRTGEDTALDLIFTITFD